MNLDEWSKRELDDIYVSTLIMKETAYKKIIDIVVPEENTTSYWFKKFNEFKMRGITDLFMVAILDNDQMNRTLKMIYNDSIKMPSMIEFYNNSRPYILQKKSQNLMSEIRKIYKSNNLEEAEELYINLKEKYKNEKLLMVIIEKYVKEIFLC